MTGLKKIDFGPLIADTTASADHLEMRDDCAPSDPLFDEWRAGRPVQEIVTEMDHVAAMVREHTARGVRFRRARIVSEPVTEYVRFLHAVTGGLNVAAGEHVRWLSRRHASDLALPGNDFWTFDDRVVRFGHFSGDGLIMGHELSEEPPTVDLCVRAFGAVWERAIPHERYQLA